MKPRTIFSVLQAILSLTGAGIAGFLYREHAIGASIPCSTGGGCDVVAASHWAELFGIPVSLIGAIAYMVLLFCAVIKLTADSETLATRIAWFMALMSTGGVFISWYYQYLAHYVIGAFCIWCRCSAIVMSLLFLISLVEGITLLRRKDAAVSESVQEST